VLGAERKVILPKGAQPNAGWSYGILTDGTLYVSGMGGEDAAGKIPASFEAEVKQSLENYYKLKAALEEICELNQQLLRAKSAAARKTGRGK